MKAFRIGVDGVEEVVVDPSDLLADDIHWDCVSLGEAHELWCSATIRMRAQRQSG